jgi:hypothetical protein
MNASAASAASAANAGSMRFLIVISPLRFDD